MTRNFGAPSSILLALALALGAPLASAETYKWVDEKGVTNYSNNPPPAAAKSAKAPQKVEDRISTYEQDPAVKGQQPTRSPYQQAADVEWLQRQQIMAARANSVDCSYPYGVDCGNWYPTVYYPAYPIVGHSHRFPRPVFHAGARAPGTPAQLPAGTPVSAPAAPHGAFVMPSAARGRPQL
jgi:hypothetical protein